MAVSGLLVFLPLLSAFVGAIIGAYANSWYRDREAKKARDRERSGLLWLLDSEIVWNRVTLNADKATYNDITTRLKQDVWQETRSELAKLLPPTLFRDIVRYYAHLNFHIHTYEGMDPTELEDVLEESSRATGSEITRLGDAIRTRSRVYIVDSDV